MKLATQLKRTDLTPQHDLSAPHDILHSAMDCFCHTTFLTFKDHARNFADGTIKAYQHLGRYSESPVLMLGWTWNGSDGNKKKDEDVATFAAARNSEIRFAVNEV